MKRRSRGILAMLLTFMLCFSEMGAFSVQAADDQLVEEYEEDSYFEDEAVSEDTMDEGSAEETFEENEGTDTDDVLAATAVADSFAGGSGTESDPYLIADYSQLLLIGKQTKDGLYYKLTADITANSKEPGEKSENVWTPVNPRNCSLDGDGHTISNLCLSSGDIDTTYKAAAMFGEEGKVKEIKNLTVKNVYVLKGGWGATLAWNATDITDCCVSGTIKFGSAFTNGFDGLVYSATKVVNCVYDAQMSSKNASDYSGIAGSGKYFENCSTTEKASVNVKYTEGMLRSYNISGIVNTVIKDGTVTNCTNSATILGDADSIMGFNVAGIAYRVESGVEFNLNTNQGNITGTSAAGLVNTLCSGAEGCLNTGKVTGLIEAAGIANSANEELSHCYNRGDIYLSGTNMDITGCAAGIAGWCGPINYCYNYGKVSSELDAAGIAGYVMGVGDENFEDWVFCGMCANFGTVEGVTSVAGLINSIGYGALHHSYNAGTVKLKEGGIPYIYVGGLVCSLGSTYSNVNEERPWAQIFDCFNCGMIDATKLKEGGVGGLIGDWGSGAVSSSYNVGVIKTGGAKAYAIGCFFEWDDNTFFSQKSMYYLKDKGIDGSIGAAYGKDFGYEIKALTASDMAKADSFVGFDFTDSWQIGKNSKYPYPELINNPYYGDPVASPSPSGETGKATVNGVEVSSLKEAFKMMKDSNTDYIVDLNSNMVGEKNLSIPKTAKSVTINGNNYVIEIVGTKLSSKTNLILTDVTLRTKNKKGAPAKLNLSSSKGLTINGNVKFEASKTSVKSGAEITMNGWLSADSINCKELVLKPGSTLKIEAGSKVSVKNKLTGDGGSIELGEGFNKPINLGGTVEGSVKFIGAVQADGTQILKCSAKKINADVLKKSFDVKGITSNTIATYLYYSGNGKAGIFGEAIEFNGSKYGLWKDAVAAMNIDKKGGTNVFSVSLLGDVNLNGKFLLPKKGYESITIAGNGHKMTFTSDINLTGNTVISGVTLIKVNKKGVQVSGKVKKGKFSYEGPETF